MKIGEFESYLLKLSSANSCQETEIIQSLWSGYGKISRYTLSGGTYPSVVVKHINLKNIDTHPRGWHSNFGHNRKIKSYQVETNWYKNWQSECNNSCYIPKFIGSYKNNQHQWIILEDLKLNYPSIKNQLTLKEVKTVIKWLANFHSCFINSQPNGLWETGTYWHLATRPHELKRIKDTQLREKAASIDQALNSTSYKTIVHGDAKLANFCFSENGESVAAVDFQYVGGGCGMKDLAYFLGSCLTGEECEHYEGDLLHFYFKELSNATKNLGPTFNFSILEAEWRSLYPFGVADFARFLLGWAPEHHKINTYSKRHLEKVMALL
jgi:hypothetical protein